ncbi:recombinase family protein [Corynebacterium diphtheriae]|uniref:recombinase family protein n=1 Tax=Corynebacterium diphtheriae TaxID=1717 RepID=UPI001FD1ECDB|nr:recombinase family protein [Corynebacterium diphtheriae]
MNGRESRCLPNRGQVHRIFTDEVSGATRARPGLEEALRYVREGDQLIVTSMDRCARSLSDLYGIVDGLVGRGVSVVFLKEVQTYSKDSSPVSRLMLGLLGSVAEFERAIIRERQAEGIAQAKARGVYKGRAPVLDASQVEQDRRWVAEGSQKQRLHVALGWGAVLCIGI